jgi:ribonuclease P protein component
MIPFSYRFHGHNSLRFVYKNGKAVRSHFATLKTIPNPHRKYPRIAVVVGKKVLKSAVGRNRIRRRIYEYVRQQISRFVGNFDIVIIVSSSEFATMSSTDLTAQIESLLTQSGLYKSPNN